MKLRVYCTKAWVCMLAAWESCADYGPLPTKRTTVTLTSWMAYPTACGLGIRCFRDSSALHRGKRSYSYCRESPKGRLGYAEQSNCCLLAERDVF